MVIEATDEMRNFDQIQVGDKVAVTYTEAVAWEVKRGPPATSVSRNRSSAPGLRPARDPAQTPRK